MQLNRTHYIQVQKAQNEIIQSCFHNLNRTNSNETLYKQYAYQNLEVILIETREET